jgi:hypothetical protein
LVKREFNKTMAFVPFIKNYSLNGTNKIIEWDKSKKLIKEERS